MSSTINKLVHQARCVGSRLFGVISINRTCEAYSAQLSRLRPQQACALIFPLRLQLLRDVRSYKHRLLREDGEVDTVVLATHLAAVGYRVTIRTAVGGGAGQECFHNLNYEFLRVTDEHNLTQYIVDARFRCIPRLPTFICMALGFSDSGSWSINICSRM